MVPSPGPSISRLSGPPVLLVADLFHPVDDLAVQRLLNGDMRHRGRGRCAMPVLLTRRKPDHIPWVDFLDRAAPSLHPSAAGRDDQGLTEWMGVPCRARARFERDAGATSTCRIGRLEQRIDPYGAGEPVRRSLARGCEPLRL